MPHTRLPPSVGLFNYPFRSYSVDPNLTFRTRQINRYSMITCCLSVFCLLPLPGLSFSPSLKYSLRYWTCFSNHLSKSPFRIRYVFGPSTTSGKSPRFISLLADVSETPSNLAMVLQSIISGHSFTVAYSLMVDIRHSPLTFFEHDKRHLRAINFNAR